VAGKHFESAFPYDRPALRYLPKYLLLLVLLTSSLAAAPRKFIVEFTEPPSARGLRNRLSTDAARAHLQLHVRREFSRAFQGAAVELPEGQSVEALSRLPYVAAVYLDTEVVAYGHWGQVSPVSSPAPRSSPKAGFRLPTPNSGGAGIVVAILDTGIDGTHPALAGKVIGGYDFVNDDNDPMDDHQHGTHVAGIIAAQSAEVTGVATGVKLLAYKVLGADGKGNVSDIIAALERALDPNGDGNLSDRAHVANLSLGNSGRPDDPLSRAVDNAVAAGMVVCVAAGNEGLFHRIGSPAGAAKAITVGASDYEEGELLAYFSSRGPATQTTAIKPDLIAPGARILSTGLDHGFVALSGTSMATPHVAGLAALLLEEHPGWTPERVKAALVTSARPVADEEVMAQGSGLADLGRARANVLVASPTQLNFGLDGGTGATFSATRHITLRNDSAVILNLQPVVTGTTAAIAISGVPAELTLAPGQTAELDVTINVDHALLGRPQTQSLAFSGVVVLDHVRLPWAFVRAGRATITAEGGLANLLWGSDVPRYASPASLGGGAYELLLEPATYDFVMVTAEDDDLRVAVIEQQQVQGDVELSMNDAMSPHEVRLAGTDERGTPFPDGDGETTIHSTLVRLVVPNNFSLALPLSGRVLHTSSLSDRYALLATESFVDRAAARVHVAQFEPLRGVSSDRVLQVSPGDYAAQTIDLDFPSTGSRRDITIMPRDWPRRPNEFSPQPPSLKFAVDAPSWRFTLFLTREVHADYASGVQLAMHTAGDPLFPAAVISPMIRRNANGFFATRGFGDSPLPVSAIGGESIAFGRGAIHIPGLLRIDHQGMAGDAEIYGNRGERRRSETLISKVRVFDEHGAEVSAGNVMPGGFYVPLPGAGRFKAEVRVPTFSFDNQVGQATLTTSFDTTQGVAFPPSLTSLAILDGSGRHATRLPANGNASLIFSAADHEEFAYRRVVDSATKVFFRRRNTNTWVQLTPVATGEETATNLGRSPSGVIYRVDLEDALRLGPGEYELAIEIGDEQGNSTTWQLAPAFIVETGAGGRRRAVGK
jgi:subtilisin family serine protease